MTDWFPSDALIDELATTMRQEDLLDDTAWFDTETHTLVFTEFDEDELDDVDPTDLPDWRRQKYAAALLVAEDTANRFHLIPYGQGGGRLTTFLRTIDDPDLADALWAAKRGGRGAYRRVRDVLHRRGLEQLWYDFEARQDRQMVLDWLEKEGLVTLSDDDDDDDDDSEEVVPKHGFSYATPIFCVEDLAASLTHYTDVLGFEIHWRQATLACVARGEVSLVLGQQRQGRPGAWVNLHLDRAGQVDDLYAEYQQSGANVVRPPQDEPLGTREMHVADPDGNTLRIAAPRP